MRESTGLKAHRIAFCCDNADALTFTDASDPADFTAMLPGQGQDLTRAIMRRGEE